MKQLIWKEWYELRRLPAAGAACVALILVCAKLSMVAQHLRFDAGDIMLPLYSTWVLVAVLAGAGLFAQEVGSGNLQLLDSLPISRRRLWLVKAISSFGVLLLTILVSLFVWAFVVRWLMGGSPTEATLWQQVGTPMDLTIYLLVVPASFAVALAVSPFTDRTISAFGTTVISGVIIAIGLGLFGTAYANNVTYHPIVTYSEPTPVFVPLICLVSGACISLSYWTFTRGESLRSAKRFRIGLQSGVSSVALAAFAFWVGTGMNWW